MAEKKTCGPMYLDALHQYCGDPIDEEKANLFAAGFISGQAEKVYLGACTAAMFRPSADRRSVVESMLDEICGRYGLEWVPMDDEIWIIRHEHLGAISFDNAGI